MKTTDYIKDWEKEFDYHFHLNDGKLSDVNVHDSAITLKDFIRTLISQVKAEERERILREAESMKEEITNRDVYGERDIYWEKRGINRGIDRILNALSTSEGEECKCHCHLNEPDWKHYACNMRQHSCECQKGK